MLKYYHYITGHKNYHILYDKIISEGYYCNALIDKCRDFIKNCNNCVSKNKYKFLPPPTNQILCERPKELYVIDITLIPKELVNNNDKFVYLLSIIDQFSKFAANYILKNKTSTSVLIKLKDFFNIYGVPDKILSDNGKEFVNKNFKNFFKKYDIKILHGRARHPQTQGAVERYNRTIKDILKSNFLEKEKIGEEFNLIKELEIAIEIYNKTKHSSIGYSPYFVFNSNDEKVFKKVKMNTIKSQLYKVKYNMYIENKYGLLCEHFHIAGNKIKKPNFGAKGRYSIPVKIIKGISNSEYEIQLTFNYKDLKKNLSYYVEYILLKLCTENCWNELIINFKKED
jgi:hypothetical protein